jgi:D-alanyl-lipoteichoic acid acyltransferase DltB (MBOAT superfamily)
MLAAIGTTGLTAALPFVFSVELPYLRSVVAAAAVVTAVKFADWLRGTYRDRELATHRRRFLVWWLFAPETRWSDNPARRKEARSSGIRRLVRGSFKVGLFAVGAATLPRTDLVEAPYALVVVATCLQFYFVFSGIADAYSALPELFGFRTAEMFNRPFLATSPGDFWSRRWNLFVARAAAQHIFFPLDGRKHRVRGTLVVFLASGVMHEYFVVAALGARDAKFGYMMAFFLLQGLAVVVHHVWLRTTRQRGRLWRPLAIVLHTAWFTCTTPLFFAPLAPLLEFGGTGFQAPTFVSDAQSPKIPKG